MLVKLSKGRASVELLPEAGGAIAAFRWDTAHGVHDWLRRPSDNWTAKAEECGCFPLVPFSNRVRDGRFTFEDRPIRLPVDPATGRHFEHGHGWRHPWAILHQEAARVVMRYDHRADAWPWRYRAEQDIEVSEDALACRISVTNLAAGPMPMGLGLHPYFPVTPRARLHAGVAGYWIADRDVLPISLASLEPEVDPNRGLALARVDLDTVFSGWRHCARIEWPERQASLEIHAGPPLDFLVIYVPPGEGYCCVEPVSNMTDAFNFAAAGHHDTGLIVLAPGATVSASMRLVPELHSSEWKGSIQ